MRVDRGSLLRATIVARMRVDRGSLSANNKERLS